MKELDVLRLLLARRDNYSIAGIEHFQGRIYTLTMAGEYHRAVVLSRSFEYYERRYHLAEQPPTLIVCFAHDTVVPVTVLSLRAGHLANPYELPAAIRDVASQRFGKVGSQVLIGQYISGVRTAQEYVGQLPDTTRKRYLLRVRELGRRKRGKPVGKAVHLSA